MHLVFSANGVLLFAALPEPLILLVFKLHSHQTVTVLLAMCQRLGACLAVHGVPRDTMLTIGVRNESGLTECPVGPGILQHSLYPNIAQLPWK